MMKIIKKSTIRIIPKQAYKPKPKPANPFPAAWSWFVDELLVHFAKEKFSPRDSWKNKPFSKEDARFFFKGIEELSDLFTEDRPRNSSGRGGIGPYFNHPKYRCAYLLYFLPLQAAKFLTLFDLHAPALQAAFTSGSKRGVIRISDIGAGPGTASIAFLLWVLKYLTANPEAECPPIEFYWSDTNSPIMQDGKFLIDTFANNFPKLRAQVTVQTSTLPWWTSASLSPHKTDLTFMGHVLNESNAPGRTAEIFWENLLKNLDGGGLLLLEPAARRSSQLLSRLRNSMFEQRWIEQTPTRIWGPCLHAGACPLSEGRDWCHFSVPSWIPGEWFKQFSESLGSERQWVKFSYLWIASENFPSPVRNALDRRVISDSLNQGPKPVHLLCEPEVTRKWSPLGEEQVWRGDIIRLGPASAKIIESLPSK